MIRNFISLFFSLIILIILFACSKENDHSFYTHFRTPVVIHGYEIRTETGDKMGTVGNPDINCFSPFGIPLGDADLFILTAPNPGWDRIIFHCRSRSIRSLSRITIVPAYFHSLDPCGNIYAGMNIPSHLPVDTSFFLNPESGNTIRISNLPDGYYRVYMETQDILLWDNFVKITYIP